MGRRASAGRPEATSHEAIEQAAFGLFAERGFDGTTLEQIAGAVGVTRRTLFRYFASKNDIPWGRFDDTLVGFRRLLDDQPDDVPLPIALGNAIVEFNRFDDDIRPAHADRMRLVLETPTLQAHSALKYAEWRAVVAEYAARRLGEDPASLRPQLLGHVALAIALTAYEQWLTTGPTTSRRLLQLLRRAVAALDDVYSSSP